MMKLNKSLLFACVWAVSFVSQMYAKKGKKPNVLVIYTDDHRYTGVHALGGQVVRTPYMDQLANDGIAFTNTFLMGAFTGATSVASRAMLMTGRNLFQQDGVGHTIQKENTTLGEAFRQAGYYAYHVGKWHQDFASLARSFDGGGKVSGKPAYLTDQYRMPYSDWNPEGIYKPENSYLLEYDKEGKVIRRPFSKTDKRGPVGTENTGPHVSEVLADDAVEFIGKYDKKQPFFMYLAFPCPHDPRQAHQKYKDMYPEEQIQLLPSYMPQHPFDNGHYVLRDEMLGEWPRTEEIARKHLSDYYAIITHLDDQIGRVIKELKRSGEYENTVILFAGDSGLAVGNHGLLGKQNLYDEDGIHVPFIISGGLIKEEDKGRREDAFCYIHDIMPTACDLANIPVPASVTGKSLLPVIEREKEQIRDYTYHAYLQYQRAYRKGDYKLIEYVRAPEIDVKGNKTIRGSYVTQLFNVTKDPWEVFNLAYFPEYKELLGTMQAEMKSKAMELGDTADGKRVKIDFWEYYKKSGEDKK